MRKYSATPKSYVGPPVKKEKGWRKCEKVRESVKRKVGERLEEVRAASRTCSVMFSRMFFSD